MPLRGRGLDERTQQFMPLKPETMAAASSNRDPTLAVHWIVEGVSWSDEGRWTSQLASNRYRAVAPAQWLSDQGHRMDFIAQHRWKVERQDAVDAIVVGKLIPYGDDPRQRQRIGDHVLDEATEARRRGAAVIADFCDDHFEHATLGSYWRRLAQAAHVCVAGSEAMARALLPHAAGPVHVIGDPLVSPRGAPRVYRRAGALTRLLGRVSSRAPTARLNLVWYGEASNWPAMQSWAEHLAPLAKEQAFDLTVVTRPDEAILAYAKGYNRRHRPLSEIEVVPWSEPAQWRAVDAADIVLIPVDLADRKRTVKTGNRLTDALHAGRHVIASPLEAYQPFAAAVSLTDAPLDALRRYLAAPDHILAGLTAGQQAADAACAPAVIGQAWLDALRAGQAQARA